MVLAFGFFVCLVHGSWVVSWLLVVGCYLLLSRFLAFWMLLVSVDSLALLFIGFILRTLRRQGNAIPSFFMERGSS